MKLLQNILALTAISLAVVAFTGCGSTAATANNAQIAATPGAAPPSVNPASDVRPPSTKEEPVAKPAADPPPIDPAQTPAVAPVSAPVETGRIVDKTFDDIKFPMQPGEPFRREMVSHQVEALAGQRIRIRGYILPTPQKRGIKQFVLVRDNQECCLGRGAALYDCVLVEMQAGHTAAFSIRPVAVEGTFGIEVIPGPDDKPLAIYHMQGEAVQ